MLFDQRQAVRAGDLVLYQNEAEGAVAAVFDRYILDGGGAADRCIDAKRLVEGEAAASPHAAGQRHGGQEATSGRVAVGSQQRLPGSGEEVEPVPQRRQRITGLRRRIVAVERR